MNRSSWAMSGAKPVAKSCVLAAACSMGLMQGQAFAAEGDTLSLKIANALQDRFFMRASVLGIKVKTKSGDTYDVTGPVLTRADLAAISPKSITTSTAPSSATAIRDLLISQGTSAADAVSATRSITSPGLGLGLLIKTMDDLGVTQLGTPVGITGEAKKSMSTAGLSLGYYLDDNYRWVVETFVLAAPLSTSVTAHGRATLRADPDSPGDVVVRPMGLEGQKIISSKLLPPTVMFGRYWGGPGARFQPYTGLMAMYAIFYDTKATDALNSYVGGSTPGSTTVSFKNAFGAGPMVGFKYEFNDSWHVGLNVGSVRLKTVATITTRNTLFTGKSGAVQDFGYALGTDLNNLLDENGNRIDSISDIIQTGEVKFADPDPQATNPKAVSAANANGGLTSLVSKAVGYARGQSSLGTYVRKNETTLDSTILMLSVGYKF